MTYYAHSANAKGDWQPLKDHLQNVAALAKKFAEEARPGDMKGGDHKDYYEKYCPTWRC